MTNRKYSRQREAIKNFLASRTDHPTADTVYQNIRVDFPNISLGTVYRNLGLLAELGEISKLNTGDGAERFDYNTAPHYHFVCSKCHEVQDLMFLPDDTFLDFARQHFAGRIDSHQTTFFGVCEHCIKKS